MKILKFPQILIFNIAAVLLFAVFAAPVFAYEPDPTHRLLTQKTAQLFGGFSDEEINWLIQGAIEEDTPPRWVNHFYDPKTGQGWNSQRMGSVPQNVLQIITNLGISRNPVSSLEWAHNQNLQAEYTLYKGDQTWETAVYHYVRWLDSKNKDDKKKSLIALGHILHLLQDLSVPAHTRQDTHSSGDPYEKWVARFNSIDNLNFHQTMDCSTLDDCFIQLAKYSQENFFSKETINDAFYNYPSVKYYSDADQKNQKYAYGNDNFPLFKISLDPQTGEIKSWQFDDLIHSSYFQRLAPKAVVAGVAAMRLFFQEAEIGYQFPQTLKSPLAAGLNILRLSALGEILRLGNFFQNIGQAVNNIFSVNSQPTPSPVVTPPLFAVSPAGGSSPQPTPKIISTSTPPPVGGPTPQIAVIPAPPSPPPSTGGSGAANSPSPEVLGWQSASNPAGPTIVYSHSPPRMTPTPEPSPTPEITPEATPEATPEPSPAPEFTPEPAPETTPDPTPEPTPELTPSPTPLPEPSTIKILISEIQISGQTSDDEFIELYNPNDFDVDLTGYRMKRATDSGNLVSFVVAGHFSGQSIKSKGYLLLAHPDYAGSVAPDIYWPQSYNLAKDNSLILYDFEGKIVDTVGWGNAKVFETAPYPENPGANQSLERKAFATSTAELMTTGLHRKQGNGYDSNNNSSDFIFRSTSDPQNSQSPQEPPSLTDFSHWLYFQNWENFHLGDFLPQDSSWQISQGSGSAFIVEDRGGRALRLSPNYFISRNVAFGIKKYFDAPLNQGEVLVWLKAPSNVKYPVTPDSRATFYLAGPAPESTALLIIALKSQNGYWGNNCEIYTSIPGRGVTIINHSSDFCDNWIQFNAQFNLTHFRLRWRLEGQDWNNWSDWILIWPFNGFPAWEAGLMYSTANIPGNPVYFDDLAISDFWISR